MCQLVEFMVMETGSFQEQVIKEHIEEEITTWGLKQINYVRTLFVTLLYVR